MPIINGLKMACEPCIRGHRSTKCTHAKERLMVPVRKPGRPLSVCPHPPGKPCVCGGITAAIPRAQKCGCGPSASTPEPAAAVAVPTDSIGLKGSMSPTRRTFQVQKTASKAASRKQSFDLANLERMDPDTYSIHSAPPYRSPMPAKAPPEANSGSSISPISGPDLEYLGSLPETLGSPTSVGLENGVEYRLLPQLDTQHSLSSPVVKPETPGSAVGSLANVSSYLDGYHTGLNGAEHSPALQGHEITPTKAIQPTATPPRSCCAKTAAETNVNGNGHTKPSVITAMAQQATHYMHPETVNGGGLGDGGAPINRHHHMINNRVPTMTAFPPAVVQPIFYAQSADPTIYTYPPYYGTYQHPIQPPQWRQAMPLPAGLGYAFPAGHAHMGPLAHGMTVGVGGEAAPARFDAISHQCTCGDSCNCLGCPAHPYNEITQDYVRSAMSAMTQEPQREGSGPRLAEAAGGSCCRGGGGGGGGGTEHISAGNAEGASPTAVQAPGAGVGAGAVADQGSPPQAQTPSEASAASEDQTQLSASDFLFVTYPFGCEGETASCPCGDDCQCVGCLIHSHPYPNDLNGT